MSDDVYVDPDLSTLVAQDVSLHPVFDEIANEVAVKAQALWLTHFWTGHIAMSTKVVKTPGKKGVTDRYVLATGRGVQSAEFGHFLPKSTKYIYGLHLFGRISGGHW